MTKHTPGPWSSAVPPSSMLTVRWIKGPNNESVALVGYRDYNTGSQGADLANARLIAAAPELLAVLEDLLEQAARNDAGIWLDIERFKDYVASAAHTAIAKAKGDRDV